MHLTFLGTGSAIPIPRHQDKFDLSSPLHDCHQCRSNDPRDRRWPSALLIDGHILIDAGPPIVKLLESVGVNPTRVEAVLLTHRHRDAAGGLPALGQGIRQIFPGSPGTFRVGQHNFQAFQVPHDNRTWGYLVDEALAYFSDYSDIRAALPALRRANIAILDGSGWEQAFPTHQPMKEVIPVVKAHTNLEAIYFTHVGHTRLTHMELERKTKNLGDDRFHIAYHGLKLALNSTHESK